MCLMVSETSRLDRIMISDCMMCFTYSYTGDAGDGRVWGGGGLSGDTSPPPGERVIREKIEGRTRL